MKRRLGRMLALALAAMGVLFALNTATALPPNPPGQFICVYLDDTTVRPSKWVSFKIYRDDLGASWACVGKALDAAEQATQRAVNRARRPL